MIVFVLCIYRWSNQKHTSNLPIFFCVCVITIIYNTYIFVPWQFGELWIGRYQTFEIDIVTFFDLLRQQFVSQLQFNRWNNCKDERENKYFLVKILKKPGVSVKDMKIRPDQWVNEPSTRTKIMEIYRFSHESHAPRINCTNHVGWRA